MYVVAMENRTYSLKKVNVVLHFNAATLILYTLRRPVMREVLSSRIWGVSRACLGSR